MKEQLTDKEKALVVKYNAVLSIAKTLPLTPRHGECNSLVAAASVQIDLRSIEGKERMIPIGRCKKCDQPFVLYRIGEWQIDTSSSEE